MSVLIFGVAFGLIFLLLDMIFPGIKAGGLPYAVPIVLSLWFPWRHALLSMAVIGSVFTTLGYFFTGGAETQTSSLVDLGFDLVLLWITAFLIFRYLVGHRSPEEPEGRLRALVDTAVDGVIIIDSSGIVQDFNPACEKLFGYSAREVTGRNVSMLMPSPYRDEHDAYLERYRETGERRIIGIGREVEGRRRDGSTFPLELSVGEASHGNQRSFVGIIRDITARKAAEKALKAAKEQAESANQAKSLFLANMSHEIRTPMNAVLGYTQIMENDPAFPERHRRGLEAVTRAGNHLLGVINQILDLSKIEAGAMEIDADDFDIEEMVASIATMFDVRCEQKGLVWTVDNRIDRGNVRGDQGKLRQVLINLLGNAVKFTERGSVCLRVSQSGDLFHFEVIDTGSGIAPTEHERIFDPFQQAEEGTKKGGTGLGLTLSRRHIELMGGKLELTSDVGEGSRFSFDLALPPAQGPVAPGSLTAPHVVRLAPGFNVRALVVDDVADNRNVLAGMLETIGVEAAVAKDGVDALEMTRTQRPPDIIFMDIRMPVMDGITTMQHIRQEEDDRRIVCVATSAAGWSHDAKNYVEAGFDDFIAKPYRFETVWQCLEKHLDVSLERKSARVGVVDKDSKTLDPTAAQLPEKLRRRLLQSARVNAFTDVEAVLAELEELGDPERELVEHLRELLQRYDSRAIVDLMERVATRQGEQP